MRRAEAAFMPPVRALEQEHEHGNREQDKDRFQELNTELENMSDQNVTFADAETNCKVDETSFHTDQENSAQHGADGRDPGVDDAVWAELLMAQNLEEEHAAKLLAEEEERKRAEAQIEADLQAKQVVLLCRCFQCVLGD